MDQNGQDHQHLIPGQRVRPRRDTDAALINRKMKFCTHATQCNCTRSGGDCTWDGAIRMNDAGDAPLARTAADMPPGRIGRHGTDDNTTRAEFQAYRAGVAMFFTG